MPADVAAAALSAVVVPSVDDENCLKDEASAMGCMAGRRTGTKEWRWRQDQMGTAEARWKANSRPSLSPRCTLIFVVTIFLGAAIVARPTHLPNL